MKIEKLIRKKREYYKKDPFAAIGNFLFCFGNKNYRLQSKTKVNAQDGKKKLFFDWTSKISFYLQEH